MAEIALQTLKDNPNMYKAALEFSEKEHNAENIHFYYYEADAKQIYEKYVAKNAPKEVNLSESVALPMHALAAKNDWNSPAWEDCLKAARAEVARLWNGDTRRRFKETAQYRALAIPAKATAAVLTAQKAAAAAVAAQPAVRKEALTAPAKATAAVLTAQKAAVAAVVAQKASSAPMQKEPPVAEPIKADPKKAAKILGITNAKSIALLTKANDLNFKGDKNGALTVFKELVANENMKMTPEAFMKEFQKMLAKNQKLNKV